MTDGDRDLWRRAAASGARAILACALLLTGCGSSTATVAARTIEVRFGARAALSGGLSADEELRPARFVEVRAIDADGSERDRAVTDAEGRATLDAASDGAIVVTSRYRRGDLHAWVSRDAQGRTAHEHRAPIGGSAELAIELSDAQPMAGALHLLDTLAHGLETVERWRGVAMPPLFAHWGRGETTDWSYYLGEVPRGSGQFGLVLMGGEPGRQATTDTDEHDEGIVLHELGHYVMDRRTGDSSIGGRHPPGSLTDPGVAWEEGRATFFAVAVLAASGLSRDAIYRDTIGVVPTGHCRVDQDVEAPDGALPRGHGAQESVTAILWDLADGAGDLPDRDEDGVALGPAAVLEAMEAHWAEEGSYPALTSFLDFLVRTNRVSRAELAAMLARTGEPASLLETEWPAHLALGGSVEGEVDGLSDPAPSGGEPRPENGLDAVRAFRVVVDRAGTLAVEVSIHGSGTRGDHTQLALELRDRRARAVARAASSGPGLRASSRVEPGTYVIYVRDAGDGNRAAFRLRATLAP